MSEWISVEDRLPAQYQKVFTFDIPHGINVCYYDTEDVNYDYDSPWWHDYRKVRYDVHGVTHWKPVCETPE